MKITFVTESHLSKDDKQSVYVAEQKDLEEANNRIATLERASDNNERVIGNLLKKVNQTVKTIDQNTKWIHGVEARVDAMPQTLCEALERAWKETFADRLAMGEKVFADLRQESERMSTELADLRRQRDEMKVEMENLRKACDEMKNLYETRLKTLGDRLSDAWRLAFEKA